MGRCFRISRLDRASGRAADEKLEIARRYLVRRQLDANGLKAAQAEIKPDALRLIIRSYTREAGVRNLEREIGKAFRNVAVQIAEGSTDRGPKDSNAGNDYGDRWILTMSAEIEKYPRFKINALTKLPAPHKRHRRTNVEVDAAKAAKEKRRAARSPRAPETK